MSDMASPKGCLSGTWTGRAEVVPSVVPHSTGSLAELTGLPCSWLISYTATWWPEEAENSGSRRKSYILGRGAWAGAAAAGVSWDKQQQRGTPRSEQAADNPYCR